MEVQKMKKRILAAALAVSMLFGSASVLPQGAVEQWLSLGAHAQTVVKSGTCGENVTWTLDDQGTVTISGSGEIIDFVDFGPDESLSPFRGKESIKKVIIEDGITHIGRVCFEDCKNLVEIVIPESVESVGDDAFQYTPWLTKQREENNIVIAGKTIIASEGCTGELIIPDGVKRIASYAFYNRRITSVVIPDSVTDIGSRAFSSSGITVASLGNGVKTITLDVFSECKELRSVYLGSSVETIQMNAFGKCGKLAKFEVSSDNPHYSSIGGVVYNKAGDSIVLIPSGIESIDIPAAVTSISNNAFNGCTNLKNVTIPESVTSIGDGAFDGCSVLESIVIPNSVTNIGSSAFDGCSSLKKVVLPVGLTYIPSYCFGFCSSLEEFVVPDSVTSIGASAFYCCRKLKCLVLHDNIEEIKDNAFEYCDSLVNFSISSDSEKYSCVDGVLYNKDGTELVLAPPARVKLDIPQTVSSIREGAFRFCYCLKEVNFPDAVNTLPAYLFQNCGALESITLPKSINYIDKGVFIYCTGLKSVYIPDNVYKIGMGVFAECDNLTEIRFPRGLVTIEDGAFSHCSKLKDIELPENLKTIEDYAFNCCVGLSDITIPESVTTIGRQAFFNCTELKTVTIPESVETIGDYAFGYIGSDKIPDFKIRCYKFSAAEKYAKQYGFDIEYLINEKDRFAGDDRYSTAAAISGGSFSRANTVVLASGLDHADALAGVPLAAAFSAPILLTKKTSLPQATLDEIKRLKAKNVIILGGEGAVGSNVEQALKNNDLSVERIAGKTRFETAVKIAQRVGEKTGSKPSGVFFVNAFGFADALSASSAAAASGSVIIYLRSDGTLDSATEKYLSSIKGSTANAYVIGGEGVVSDEIAKLAGTALGADSIKRIAGENRYKTCAQVNKQFADVLSGKAVCVAKGLDFPDALAGGVFAAMTRSPILLADDSFDDSYGELLGGRDLWKIYVFGGKSAVPDELVKSLYQYIT